MREDATLPRSPRTEILGIPWLARAVDKGRMHLAGRLGEYEFPCPADAFILDLLTLSPEDFLSLLANSSDDEGVALRLAPRISDLTSRERISLEVFCIKNSRLFDSLDKEEGRKPMPETSPSGELLSGPKTRTH